MAVCTGCSLLCDDIEITEDEEKHVHTACRKGAGLFLEVNDKKHKVDGNEASLNEAIETAAEVLAGADNPLIYGLDNTTCEAQQQGLELAREVGAVLDDTSSFCHGPTLQLVLQGEVKSCTLDEVRDEADVLVYWGCDPVNSHPRHMSRFSYFPRGEKRQHGYEEDRDAICFDVRPSDTAKICKDNYLQVPPGEDMELMSALREAASGKLPKTGFDKKKVMKIAQKMKKAEYPVVFGGLGLLHSVEIDELKSFLNDMSLRFMPMVGHYNMRGLNQLLLEEVGHINRLSFKDGVESGAEYSVVNQLREERPDAVLVVGADPVVSLPRGGAKHLHDVPMVTLDPMDTPTCRASKVAIHTGRAGIGTAGTVVRMDGEEVEMEAIEDGWTSDEEVLKMIREAI